MKLSPTIISAAIVVLCSSPVCGQLQPKPKVDPTLKQITAEPDWIARSPTNARWLVDGSAIKFSQRREGLVGRDFSDEYLIFLSTPDTYAPIPITSENPGPYFISSGDWNEDHSLRLLNNAGDLFLYNADSQSTTQLTQSGDAYLRALPRVRAGDEDS